MLKFFPFFLCCECVTIHANTREIYTKNTNFSFSFIYFSRFFFIFSLFITIQTHPQFNQVGYYLLSESNQILEIKPHPLSWSDSNRAISKTTCHIRYQQWIVLESFSLEGTIKMILDSPYLNYPLFPHGS